MSQTTFSIDEIKAWLDSLYQAGLVGQLHHDLSVENIIKANIHHSMNKMLELTQKMIDIIDKDKELKESEIAQMDYDLYPGNEAGAFDYLDKKEKTNVLNAHIANVIKKEKWNVEIVNPHKDELDTMRSMIW